MYRNDSYGRGWSAAFTDAYTAGGGTVLEREPAPRRHERVARLRRHREAHATRRSCSSPAHPPISPASFGRSAQSTPTRPCSAATPCRSSRRRPRSSPAFATLRSSRRRTHRSPEAKAFVSAFTKKYGVPPEQRSALAYDATMLIGHAALEGAPTRPSVRDYPRVHRQLATGRHRRHRSDRVRSATRRRRQAGRDRDGGQVKITAVAPTWPRRVGRSHRARCARALCGPFAAGSRSASA